MYSRVQCTKSNENVGENEFVTHRTLPCASINIMTHCRHFVLNRPKCLFFVWDIVAFLFLIRIYKVVRKSPTDAAFLCDTWHNKLTQQTGDRKNSSVYSSSNLRPTDVCLASEVKYQNERGVSLCFYL